MKIIAFYQYAMTEIFNGYKVSFLYGHLLIAWSFSHACESFAFLTPTNYKTKGNGDNSL